MSDRTVGSLKVVFPNGNEQIITLRDGDSLKAGRDESNDIVLDDAGVSRVHASFNVSSRGVVVADLASTNGVFVNGQQLSSMKDLASSDIVDIGASKITLTLTPTEMDSSRSVSNSARAMTAQLKTQPVVVLVSVVKDYLSLSRELPVSDSVEMLFSWTNMTKKLIEEGGGVVDKVVENSIVSLWLGPNAEEIAAKAMSTARMIDQRTEALAANEWKHKEQFPWVTTLLLSSGTALCGSHGAGALDEQNISLMGDPINRAFELEKYADSLNASMLFDSDMQGLLQGVSTKMLGSVLLQDQDEEVAVYTIEESAEERPSA